MMTFSEFIQEKLNEASTFVKGAKALKLYPKFILHELSVSSVTSDFSVSKLGGTGKVAQFYLLNKQEVGRSGGGVVNSAEVVNEKGVVVSDLDAKTFMHSNGDLYIAKPLSASNTVLMRIDPEWHYSGAVVLSNKEKAILAGLL